MQLSERNKQMLAKANKRLEEMIGGGMGQYAVRIHVNDNGQITQLEEESKRVDRGEKKGESS